MNEHDPTGPQDDPGHGHEVDPDPDDLDAELELEGGDLGMRLRSLLDPAADLPDRMTEDVDRALRGRSLVSTAIDLMGLGAWTARALLTDPLPRADGDREGT